MIRKAIAFGTFAALSLTLTIGIAARIARFEVGTDRYELVATFDDVTNLKARDEVRLAGVPIGQVTGVRVVQGRARVTFEVDAGVALPEDSTVAVQWLNLIGQRELSLRPGISKRLLGDGDTVTKTHDVVDLGALLNQLGPLTQAVNPAQLNQVVQALVLALDGKQGQVDQMTRDLAAVLETLAARKGTIASLIADYDAIAHEVARRDLQVASLVSDLATLTGAFADSGQVLDDALTHLPRLAAGLQTLLSQNADELGRTIDSLALVTGTVHAHLGDFTTILDTFTDAEATLLRATSYGQFVLINPICISSQAPPDCPTPVIRAGSVPGVGALNSTERYAATLLGGAP
jgi:phospholipid/cholesterol/gamma-HCH transport system substrate-binding protein